MKIERVTPPPPPPPPDEIVMTFSKVEGWAVLAAIKEWAEGHPDAAHVKDWREWAFQLEQELRHGS